MKNMRKLLAIVLCLLLVTTSFATVSAEEGEFSGIVSKTVKVAENGDVEVLIDIAGNPGITALSLSVKYDSSALTFKENGFVDTGLLKSNYTTSLNLNPFRLSWNDSNDPIVNVNYNSGTIAKLYFKANDDFYGTTEIEVDALFTETFVDDEFITGPELTDAVISVTRDNISIKEGVVDAKGLNGETLIIASYNEDRMVDCKVYPNTTGNVKLTIADEINTTGATKFKALLWENLETLAPVCGCAEEIITLHQ